MSHSQENSTLKVMECGVFTLRGYWWLLVRNPMTGQEKQVPLVSATSADQLRAQGVPVVGAP